jgi:hypothetical protein
VYVYVYDVLCLGFCPYGQKTIVCYDAPIEDVHGNMIIPWKSFKERLRPIKKQPEPIPPDTSQEQLLEMINQLQLKITYLENEKKNRNLSGSERSYVSTGHSSSNSSNMNDKKYSLTGYVTDVGGRTYQVVKSVKGTLKTLRENGETQYLSGSQRERMRNDPNSYSSY